MGIPNSPNTMQRPCQFPVLGEFQFGTAATNTRKGPVPIGLREGRLANYSIGDS